MEDKHEQEAEAKGCKILGSGKNAQYRLYALPCGHEQQITTQAMRSGGFKCGACLNEKLNQEAEAQGCKLVGKGSKKSLRLYQLPCGHKKEVALSAMREGRFGCQDCIVKRHSKEAEEQGCKLLGVGRHAAIRLYALPCGHEQEILPFRMQTGEFKCGICMQEKHQQEAERHGCTLIGAGRSSDYRLYMLPCGHNKQVTTDAMRNGGFMCRVCLRKKLNNEAEAQGCKLVGLGINKRNRQYKLPCGHEQEIGTGAMRIGNFRCQTCEETSRTLPSNVYLLHIKMDSDEWLKLGYAKSVDARK